MMESTINDETPIFNECYNQIKGWMSKEQDITVDSVLFLLPRIMRVVQLAVKERKKGTYKKQLVLNLSKKLVQDCIEDEQKRKAVLMGVDLAGPALIDVTVDVALGNIDIQKLKKCVFSCC